MCRTNNRTHPDNWYARLFARLYDPFMGEFEKRILFKRRQRLLGSLGGRILDVGAGTGVNFSFYPEKAEVWAIEPSESMLAYAHAKMAQNPPAARIHSMVAGIGNPSLEAWFPEGGFDAIVCTLVLCTIPDPETALADIRRWLKPEGRLILLEHIQGQSKMDRLWQSLLNPLWRQFSEGCQLNRRTDLLVRRYGFQPDWEEYFTKTLPFYMAVGRMAPAALPAEAG